MVDYSKSKLAAAFFERIHSQFVAFGKMPRKCICWGWGKEGRGISNMSILHQWAEAISSLLRTRQKLHVSSKLGTLANLKFLLNLFCR